MIAVRTAGYESAVVAHPGLISRTTSAFSIPRIGAPADLQDFISELSGVDWLRTRQVRHESN
jgi:hypothetical protein